MNVLPASTPFASLSTMVIVGPSARSRWTAMPIATSAASSGMIQMIETRSRFLRVTTACGSGATSGSSAMACASRFGGIPDEPDVERLGGEHRQHDDGGEEQHACPRRYGRQRRELHQRHREG